MRTLDLRDPRAQLKHRRTTIETIGIAVSPLPPVVDDVRSLVEDDGRAAIDGSGQRLEAVQRKGGGTQQFRTPVHEGLLFYAEEWAFATKRCPIAQLSSAGLHHQGVSNDHGRRFYGRTSSRHRTR